MTSAPSAQPRTTREAAGVAGGLFERHGRMVYGVCRAMLRDAHESEDATQQVFLSAYEALLGGAAVRDPGAWLATIARNECRARVGAGMRRPLPVEDETLEALPSRGDDRARRAQADEIRAALAGLPERQREAIVLRYLYGLRYGEVAAALGLTRPATEALLFRARRAMRLRLRPVVAAAIVVPSVVRDELALALPGFGAGAGTGGGVAATGFAGSLLLKLAAGPVGTKSVAAVVAISTVGLVGAVPVERNGQFVAPQSLGTATGALATPGRTTTEQVGGGAEIEGAQVAARDGSRRSGSGDTDARPLAASGVSGTSTDGRTEGEHSGTGDPASAGGGNGSDDEAGEAQTSTPSQVPTGHEPETDDTHTSGGSGDNGGSEGTDASGPDSGVVSPESVEANDRGMGSDGSGSEGGSSGGDSGGSGESSSGAVGSGGDGLDD